MNISTVSIYYLKIKYLYLHSQNNIYLPNSAFFSSANPLINLSLFTLLHHWRVFSYNKNLNHVCPSAVPSYMQGGTFKRFKFIQTLLCD